MQSLLFAPGTNCGPTLKQSFLALSALRNFCAAIGRLMEIDSALRPWYACIRSPACLLLGGWQGGLVLRGGRLRESERRSTLGGFRPLSPPPARCAPVTLQGFTSRLVQRALMASHGLWAGIIGRDLPGWGRQSGRRFRICNQEQLGTTQNAPPRPFPSARHTVTLREMDTTRYMYRPVRPVTGPVLQFARCPSGQSSEEFSIIFCGALWQTRAASARHHWPTELSRLRFRTTPNVSVSPWCLSIMHRPSSNLKSQSSRSCSCKESSRRRAERMCEAFIRARSQIMAAW